MAPVQLLNWRRGRHLDRPAPCVLCGTTTPLRPHAKEPVHKACAEERGALRRDPVRVRPSKGGTTDHT